MKKYLDVDLVAELSKLVDAHVKHYKEDFDHDRKSLARAAKAELPEDKTLIWFCRESGTHCLRESQAFIRDTREHITLRFYAEQSGEDITARIVVPKSVKGNKVMGDLYEVRFKELAWKVAQDSVDAVCNRLTFEDGTVHEVPFSQSLRQAELLADEHGKLLNIHAIPSDREAFTTLLTQQRQRREKLPVAAQEEKLAPLPVAELRKYEAIKKDKPDALVCFAQNGYFELYGEDAKKAAVILGTKVLEKKVRGHSPIPVTGFKEEAWVVASKRLWKAGNDVFLTKAGDVFKDLKAADFIPVGAELQVDGILSRVEKVDFTADRVTLTNIERPDKPILYSENLDYIRGFVEDAELKIHESQEKSEKKPSSIRDKLKAAQKEVAAKPHQSVKKSQEREM